MRRLPIYFLIDVSESMIGEPIRHVEDGLRTIISELKRDPYALETAYLSILVFAGKAKTLVPLTDIISFYPPQLSIGAGTSLGTGLRHLAREMELTVTKTTTTTKGDWKPIVFMLTDGNPTDDYESDLSYWEAKYKNKTNTVVISIGDNVNPAILKRVSENVLAFDDTNPDSYQQFFKWVTASIKMQSQKVEEAGSDELNVGGFDKEKLKKIGESSNGKNYNASNVDDNYAIFQAKCQVNFNDYLIKYRKAVDNADFGGMNLGVKHFRLVGSFPLNETYKSLSNNDQIGKNTISTEELLGVPNCPSCGNRYGLCICMCGKIFCVDGGGVHRCPWCGTQAQYGRGEGPIDIGRQQG